MAHGQAREGSSGAALPFAPSNGTEQLSIHSLAQKALLLCHCFNSQAADLMKTATGAMAKKQKNTTTFGAEKKKARNVPFCFRLSAFHPEERNGSGISFTSMGNLTVELN